MSKRHVILTALSAAFLLCVSCGKTDTTVDTNTVVENNTKQENKNEVVDKGKTRAAETVNTNGSVSVTNENTNNIDGCVEKESDIHTYLMWSDFDGAAEMYIETEIYDWDGFALEKHSETDKAGTEKTIEFEDESITGKYSKSYRETGMPYNIDIYKFAGGSFELDSETDLLIRISFDSKIKKAEKENVEKLSDEEAEAFARSWLSEHYCDVSEYNIDYKGYAQNFWGFSFSRSYKGVPCSDSFGIGFTNNKEILMVSAQKTDDYYKTKGIEVLTDEQVIDELLNDETDKLVDSKIKASYKEPGEYDVSGSNRRLVLFPDGRKGMVYYVKLEQASDVATIVAMKDQIK